MNLQFDHEKLRVYQFALDLNSWAAPLFDEVSARAAVKDQLDRAATSIALNLAEGNGKFSRRDRARFFDIARGSSVECAACLDVLVSRKLVTPARVDAGKALLLEIVSMIMGLLKSLGYFGEDQTVRLREDHESEELLKMARQPVRYRNASKSKSRSKK